MKIKNTLARLSDDELLHRLSALLQDSRRIEAELIAHIAEVDGRRLYAREAASSMHVYCTEVLHLSDAEAYSRITVARASRRHPMLLKVLADGRIHLTGLVRLAPHLTPDNRDELLKRATHRSKRKIEELVAELLPRPDVPSGIRKLPVRFAPRPLPEAVGSPENERRLESGPVSGGLVPELAHPEPAPASQLVPERVAESAAPAARRAEMQPLAPERYKVQFTASGELCDKLARLQALMRSSVPDGDLAQIIDQAVTEKLKRVEAKRFGRSKAPRKTLAEADTSAPSRYIPVPVRRIVYERDGGRCTFVDIRGRRCNARERLEFHHHDRAFGRGGDHRPGGIRLACRTHNALMAEREYGKGWMDQFRRRETEGAGLVAKEGPG